MRLQRSQVNVVLCGPDVSSGARDMSSHSYLVFRGSSEAGAPAPRVRLALSGRYRVPSLWFLAFDNDAASTVEVTIDLDDGTEAAVQVPSLRSPTKRAAALYAARAQFWRGVLPAKLHRHLDELGALLGGSAAEYVLLNPAEIWRIDRADFPRKWHALTTAAQSTERSRLTPLLENAGCDFGADGRVATYPSDAIAEFLRGAVWTDDDKLAATWH